MTTTMIGQQTSMLIIASVDYQHSGSYTCRAENPAGVTSHSAQLLVNGNLETWHWKYIVYRTTGDGSFFVWGQTCQSGGFCSTYVQCAKG
jgi:hypothetical protein